MSSDRPGRLIESSVGVDSPTDCKVLGLVRKAQEYLHLFAEYWGEITEVYLHSVLHSREPQPFPSGGNEALTEWAVSFGVSCVPISPDGTHYESIWMGVRLTLREDGELLSVWQEPVPIPMTTAMQYELQMRQAGPLNVDESRAESRHVRQRRRSPYRGTSLADEDELVRAMGILEGREQVNAQEAGSPGEAVFQAMGQAQGSMFDASGTLTGRLSGSRASRAEAPPGTGLRGLEVRDLDGEDLGREEIGADQAQERNPDQEELERLAIDRAIRAAMPHPTIRRASHSAVAPTYRPSPDQERSTERAFIEEFGEQPYNHDGPDEDDGVPF